MKKIIWTLCLCIPFLAQAQQNLMQEFKLLAQQCEELGEDKPDQALTKCARLEHIAKQLKSDSLEFIALKNKISALGMLGVYDVGLQEMFRMVRLREKNMHFDPAGEVFYYISLNYFSMQDFEHSHEFALKYKQEAARNKKFSDTIQANVQIGLTLVGQGKSAEGIQTLKDNIRAARAIPDSELLVTGLDDLANAYFEMDDVEQALRYEEESGLYMGNDASTIRQASFYQHLTLLHLKNNHWDQARLYAEKALALAQRANTPEWLYECYRDMADIEDHAGRHKDALDWHRKYVDTKDSVYQKQYQIKFAGMSTLYQLENKQKAITLLEAEKKLQQHKITRLYIIIGFIVLLLLLTILFIQNHHNRKEKLLKMEFSRQLIRNQEDERLRISKELHDSVGQNLLFIKNQIQKWIQQPHETLTHSVDSALEEVRSISKNLYPNQLEQYGLLASIDDLCEKVKESSDVFTSHDLQFDEHRLDKEKKISCYRIVQECISNTLKHAQATALRITAEIKDNHLQFIIQDNGKGFSQETRYLKAHRSFGLLNMEERVKLMHGKFHIESSMGSGTKTMVSIPV